MTRHGLSPSKKLAPSISSEKSCDHRFTDDGSMVLEVDCTSCAGPQDIENRKCAAGVLNALASGVMPEAIVLKRSIHVRYRLDQVGWLCDAAAAVASLRRIQCSSEELSDRACRTCRASSRRLASDVTRMIRADPASYRRLLSGLSDALARDTGGVVCEGLDDCLRQVVSAATSDRGQA